MTPARHFYCSFCSWCTNDYRKLIPHWLNGHGLNMTSQDVNDLPCKDGVHYYRSVEEEEPIEFKCSCGQFVASIISERTEEA